MAPKQSRASGSASQAAPPRFLSSVTQRQHGIVGEKRLVQEVGIEIPSFDSVPRVREILTGYGWVPFNNMLGECNETVVEEFYANAFAFGARKYRFYDRGVYVSFRPEGQCGVQLRRASWREGAITDRDCRVRTCCLWQSCGPNGGPATLRHVPTRRRSSLLGAWESTAL
ncbi:hypothetical protein QL285_014751 [Trifolium repens]|nr:hypothetical protein QL285_014751 [Trifolium repens]